MGIFLILAPTSQLAVGCLLASSEDHSSCQASLSFRYSGSLLSIYVFRPKNDKVSLLLSGPDAAPSLGFFCLCQQSVLLNSPQVIQFESHLLPDSTSLIQILTLTTCDAI